jgi:hypothetical protein
VKKQTGDWRCGPGVACAAPRVEISNIGGHGTMHPASAGASRLRAGPLHLAPYDGRMGAAGAGTRQTLDPVDSFNPTSVLEMQFHDPDRTQDFINPGNRRNQRLGLQAHLPSTGCSASIRASPSGTGRDTRSAGNV